MKSLNGFVLLEVLDIANGETNNKRDTTYVALNKECNLCVARVIDATTNVVLPTGERQPSELESGDYILVDSSQLYEGVDGDGNVHYYTNYQWIVAKLTAEEARNSIYETNKHKVDYLVTISAEI